jgi:hypothetical protein
MAVFFTFINKPPLQVLRITIPSYLKHPDRRGEGGKENLLTSVDNRSLH